MAILLRNIRLNSSKSKILPNQPIHIIELISPFWGLQITSTQEAHTPHRAVRTSYHAIHQKVGCESQLQFSYNLYIESGHPNAVTVLFREIDTERSFHKPKIYSLFVESTDSETVRQIHSSGNARWHWRGWNA